LRFQGWFAVRRELQAPMLIFLMLSFGYLAGWGAMISSTTFRWTFVQWLFFGLIASSSVILTFVALILGLICRLNFGKGLPRYRKYTHLQNVHFDLFFNIRSYLQ
jgi:hypothetical protein